MINTGTTIVTFLMVFLIQNTQNRDSVAMQIKLDELLRAAKGAQTAMADLEDLTEEELDAFQAHYRKLAAAARRKMRASEACRSRRKRRTSAPPKGGSAPRPATRPRAAGPRDRGRRHERLHRGGIQLGAGDAAELGDGGVGWRASR